ncbi:MAG: hypothetical protein M3157_01605 [Actinomycetota bacterium]|nr:hypothetical protein [Actinomycetota bacterium]
MEDTRDSILQPSGATGAEYTRFADPSVADHFGNPAAEYAALKRGSALVERRQSILRLSGKDPAGMLNAVLTNEVPEGENEGVYAALLDPKGRVQTDLRALKAGEAILILTEPEGVEAARTILGRYAPFSRVKMEDLSGYAAPWAVLGLYGPRAAGLLGDPKLDEHETRGLEIADIPLLAAGVRHPAPGFDLIGPADRLQEARRHLVESGAVPAGVQAYETLRVQTGTPRFGPDITTENFPADAGILERAVSFTKGCYPGQETVARMHYRGHPNRELHRLTIEGDAPQPGTPILQNDRQVGRITSIAPLPVDGEILALGYLHRNADPSGALRAGDALVAPHPAP